MNAVGVTGSRYGHRWVKPTLGLWHALQPITHLVLGCATGVDRQALEWALEHDVFFVVITADWDLERRRAGILRNIQMVRLGTAWGARWLGFPVGESSGTHHCMETAADAGLEVWRIFDDGMSGRWF